MSKAKKRKAPKGFPSWLTPVKCEGQHVVLTDYGHVRVKNETADWFVRHHEGQGLKPATVQRRAERSLIAMASFMSENAWRRGKEVDEV